MSLHRAPIGERDVFPQLGALEERLEAASRAYGLPIMRNCRSSAGITSSTIASPYGPLLAELTEYASRKKGDACSKLTAIKRGMLTDTHDL